MHIKEWITAGALLLFGSSTLEAEEELSTIWVITGDTNGSSSSIASKVKPGKTHIDADTLSYLPQSNGDINEVLQYLSGIKAEGGNAHTSLNAGELEPENISINGGLFYQNNFQIDGVSNNSLLDPANSKPHTPNDVKGHPQEIFLDTDIIKSVDVYDSDVPAKFGRFAGGVIDTKTKHAASDRFSGKIRYRHTSDSLTEFFVNDAVDFEYSRSASKMQPKFDKNFYALSLNFPIDKESGIYTNITRKHSTIPVLHFDTSKSEEREIDNYFIKYSKVFDEDILDLTFAYAPYTEERFLKNTKYSDYTISGGGIRLYLNHERETDDYLAQSLLSYSYSTNKRESPKDYYIWGSGDAKPWGATIGSEFSLEGGYGDIEKTQQIVTLKSDIEIFDLLDAGAELQYGSVSFDRSQESARYQVSTANGKPDKSGIPNLECLGSDGCIDGEQYANSKNVYHAFSTDVDITRFSSYLQKKWAFDRLSLRLGMRYDYNDYMQNHDLAYRSLLTYDPFDSHDTVFGIGANRYYANAFLTYKLREAKKPWITYTRALEGRVDAEGEQFVTPGDWEENSRRDGKKTRYSDLSTPYSDEISLSLTQKLLGGKLVLKRIYRNAQDQFSKTWDTDVSEDGYRYYTLSNEGHSKYRSTTLSYSKRFGKHSFLVSANRSKTTGTGTTYDEKVQDEEEFDEGTQGSEVFLDYFDETGKRRRKSIDYKDLPFGENTHPDIVKIMYHYRYSDDLKLGIFGTYKTSYKEVERTGAEVSEFYNPQRDRYELATTGVYQQIKHKPSVNIDLSAEYTYAVDDENKLSFKLDVKNLFNQREKINSSSRKYQRGRQIWLEMSYKF